MSLTLASKKDRQWFPFIAADGQCKLEVQRIPAGKAREIEQRVLGRMRSMNLRKGTMEWDIEKQALANRELAVFALTAADKDAETDVTTQPLADALTAAGKACQVGDHICLGEVTLTDSVKSALLEEVPALVGWVLERSRRLHVQAKEESEGEA